MKFPDVRLEVTIEDRAVDMVEEGYDLVIRVNPDPDEALVGRAFLRDRLVVVGSPDFARPQDGSPIPAIVRTTGGGAESWTVQSAAGRTTIVITPVLGLSSMIMVRDAVRAGVGVARLPVSLVGPDLVAGRLVHWGDIDAPEIALWTLYPSRR
jgi:DNA-binding transcriptional LysR family regulator